MYSGFPEQPVGVVETQATDEERKLSTTAKSKPLHAVQVARETERQIGSMELFHILCEIQNQLAAQTTLQELLDVVVGLVYELTSFHRVMVYQFDETKAGTVVSEVVDDRASIDSMLLNFPSITAQGSYTVASPSSSIFCHFRPTFLSLPA